VEQVNDQTEYVSTFVVELPDRWRAELPAAVSEKGRFGEYESSYRQIGNSVTIRRSMAGRRGIEPPDALDDLIAWFDAVREDDRESISLVVLEGGLHIGEETPPAAGSLPEILLSLDDLPEGAEIAEEGPVVGSYVTMVDDPIESYGRTFGPEQILFSIGESRLMMLSSEAGAFETEAKASQTLSVFARIEPGAVLEAGMAQVAGDQVTIGEPRPLQLDGDEFESHGWVVEMSTPLFSVHVANLSAVRGRVVVSLAGVLLPEPNLDEFVQLVQVMLDRVGSHASYLEASADVAETTTTEMCTVEGLIGETPVDEILPSSKDFPESEQDCFGEESEDGTALYRRAISGRSFAFPVISSEASNVETYLGRFENSHDAMRALIELEEENLSSWIERTSGDPEISAMLLGAGESTIEQREAPELGWRAMSRSVRIRGGIRADADEVVFVRGEFLAGVEIFRLLSDADPEEAETIAARIDERLSAAIGDSIPPRPSEESLKKLESIVEAEVLIDSLAAAQDIPSALSLLKGVELSESPFDLSTNTWNLLCWYGSLNGFVDEVMHACESAVASDSTVISYVDSRGLARAVSGDITGAASDFEYVVEHAPQGVFLDTRAAWLEKLRHGENPFTDEVLRELKE
jgi:hypothetical protein